jgi:hypothetical protein
MDCFGASDPNAVRSPATVDRASLPFRQTAISKFEL